MDAATKNSEAAIWERVVEPASGDLAQAAAKSLLRLRLPEGDWERLNDLAEKARAGNMTPTEETDLANYRHVGRVLELIKSKARRSLKSSDSLS